MKIQKLIYTAVIILASFSAYPQLQVFSNGKLKVGGGTYNNAARLNISDTDNSTIYSKCIFNYGWSDAIKSEINRDDAFTFTGYYNGNRTFMVFGSGDVTCYDVYETSDSALKENVATLVSALDKVRQLRGVSYQWKASEKGEKENKIGLIAQEVEKVIPEVIQTSTEGQKAIAYSKLVALLIEAVKEQQQIIEKLEGDIADVKANCCGNATDTKSASITTGGEGGIIQAAKLYQNQPNPFSSETTIRFEVPQTTSDARLYICNMTGALLKTIPLTEHGSGSIKINARGLKAGMYLYSLVCDGKIVDTKQMLLTE
jgi:hypothetical protein